MFFLGGQELKNGLPVMNPLTLFLYPRIETSNATVQEIVCTFCILVRRWRDVSQGSVLWLQSGEGLAGHVRSPRLEV